MKNIRFSAVMLLALTFAASSYGVVGYVNYTTRIGDNFISNPLLAQDNYISALFASVPSGTSISLWDSQARAFATPSVCYDSNWSTDFELLPGTGIKLVAGEIFTITFVGAVVGRDGFVWDPDEPFGTATPPTAGVYFLGDKVPIGGGDAFSRVIGRAPVEGEQIIYRDGTTLTYGMNWFADADAGLPVAEAALFNVGPVDFTYVPEPSVAAVALVGLAMFVARRRI